MPKNNFYNIPANYQFIETLARWIIENYNHRFSDLKIFLPNQRLSKKLKTRLQEINPQIATKIKVKAVGNLDIQDLLTKNIAPEEIEEILQIKVIKKIEALFLIAEEIAKEPIFANQNFTQRYKIAKSLYDLLEDLETDQIEVSDIEIIDDSNLAKHQQFSLDFFINFHIKIKNFLLKKNLMFETQFHNFLCAKFIKIIETNNIDQDLIIAGSTGSVLSSKKLIKTIKNYDRGAVFLYGYKSDAKLTNNYPEFHPQFYLNELVNFIAPAKKTHQETENLEKTSQKKLKESSPEVPSDIFYDDFLMAPPSRSDFNDLIFNDFQNYNNFLESCANIKNNTTQDILANIEIIESNNEINEAKIITKICLDTRYKNNKIGIICNNQNLLNILKLSLNTYQVNYNNVSAQGVLNTGFISFLILIFELKFHEFNSNNLLSFIKNSYFKKLYHQNLIEEFEIKIIREARISNDYAGIENKITHTKFADFFYNIYNNLPRDKSLKSLILAFEYFANQTIDSSLSQSLAGKEIFEFLNILIAQNYQPASAEDLKVLFSDISYFEKSASDSGKSSNQDQIIDLLTPIEARLLSYDLLIICALNENDFPKVENHGWIGAKIKKELNINKSQKKIGQNGNDFCNYLNNRKIILTHSASRLNTQQLESQFLTKLKTICQILEINIDKSNFYHQNLHSEISFTRHYIKAPQSIIDKKLLPKKYYITEISKLISNPYFIYVKKILKIEELKKIDYEESYAEFGSFVHKALEEYIKNPSTQEFEGIFEKYFISTQAKLIWYPKFLKFFPKFLEDNQQFLSSKNICEQLISLEIDSINLVGKIDRIVVDENNFLHIFDYKTGKPPSKNQVLAGTEPQLVIYAYIIAESLFKNNNFAELSYWELNRNDGSKITQILKEPREVEEAIISAKSGLKALFDYFHHQSNNFFATKDENSDNIKNISRLQEWSH